MTATILFDQDSGTHAPYGDVGGVGGFTVRFHVADNGLSRGVEMVTVDTGKLRFMVLPTRGMSLWKAWHGDNDEHIGWRSPIRGPVHPSFVPLLEPSGLGWLDGFDELLVRCGLESNGAPDFDEAGRLKYPLHGRIGNKPAYKLTVGLNGAQDELSVTGWVEETRFHFLKLRIKSTIKVKLGRATIDIEDEITNLSASPAECQLLYHVNFGEPLLDAGSQLLCPASEIVPRNDHAASGVSNWNSYTAETPGYEEQVYFAKLQASANGDSRALLKNAHGTRGVGMRFNVNQLPCFTVWKNTTASEDGFVTGIEPGTNFPNPRSFEGEQGRVVTLDGKSSTTFELGIDYLADATSVATAEEEVRHLQVVDTVVHAKPHPSWCAS
jgi:hypothetical protein